MGFHLVHETSKGLEHEYYEYQKDLRGALKDEFGGPPAVMDLLKERKIIIIRDGFKLWRPADVDTIFNLDFFE